MVMPEEVQEVGATQPAFPPVMEQEGGAEKEAEALITTVVDFTAAGEVAPEHVSVYVVSAVSAGVGMLPPEGETLPMPLLILQEVALVTPDQERVAEVL